MNINIFEKKERNRLIKSLAKEGYNAASLGRIFKLNRSTIKRILEK